MTTDDKRSKLIRRAALLGAVLGVLCQALPPDHRALCGAVANLATMTCGG